MLPDAYIFYTSYLYENDKIMIVYQITNAANGTIDAVVYVFTRKGGMLLKLETGATPLPQKTEAMCSKNKSQIVSSSSLNLKAFVHSFCGQLAYSMPATTLH